MVFLFGGIMGDFYRPRRDGLIFNTEDSHPITPKEELKSEKEIFPQLDNLIENAKQSEAVCVKQPEGNKVRVLSVECPKCKHEIDVRDLFKS